MVDWGLPLSLDEECCPRAPALIFRSWCTWRVRQLEISHSAAHKNTRRVRQLKISRSDAHKNTLRVRQLKISRPDAHETTLRVRQLRISRSAARQTSRNKKHHPIHTFVP